MSNANPGLFSFGGVGAYDTGPEFSTTARFTGLAATATPDTNVFAVDLFLCPDASPCSAGGTLVPNFDAAAPSVSAGAPATCAGAGCGCGKHCCS